MELRAHRSRRGLSQRELARRAGLAYKTIQLLEGKGHDARWSTLSKLAKALKLHGPEELLRGPSTGRFLTAAEAVERMRRRGENAWKSWLFEFVDSFRRRPSFEMASRAPDPGANHRILALTACTVEALCIERSVTIPWWCAGVAPLPEPWFVADMESLKAAALLESPAAFRQRNIFVLGNFLSRA